MLCINVHAEPPLVFFPDRTRSSSLFSPLNSSADRVDAQLQSYHKAYGHQQVFAQQQGIDRLATAASDKQIFTYSQQPRHWPLHSPLLFAKDVCTARGRSFNRPATEASRRPVTSLTPLPRTLQVRAACVAVSIIWGWLQAPEENCWLMMKNQFWSWFSDLSD